MAERRKCNSIAGRAMVVAMLGIAMPLSAMQPADVRDLIGARAGAAEGDLESRGYALHHATRDRGASYTYWYNSRTRTCISITTADGRYAAIRSVAGQDCGQHGDGAAAGAAVAALAILGVAALAHRSHHHDNQEHAADAANEAAFERGHRDGLYNYPYHNYDRSDAYSSGYQSGVAQRDAESGYRRGHGSGGGGYRQSVSVSDLNGARGSSADSELRNRGFRNVDGSQVANTAYSIWYNNRTRQCLQMTVADGRVYDLRDIGDHPRCR